MTAASRKTMNLEITKKGRKWFKARRPGSSLQMEVEINAISESWEPGQTVEVSGEFIEESSGYGKVIKIYPKPKADVEKENNRALIEKWLGWVEEKATEGYVYTKGFETLKSLDVMRFPELRARADKAYQLANTLKKQELAEREKMRAERQTVYQREKAEMNEKMATVRAHRTLYALSQLPSLNAPVRQNKYRQDSKLIVYTNTGKPFRISEDDPSCFGSHLLGHEGEMGRYCYYREATAEEVADFEVQAKTKEEQAAARKELEGIFKSIQKGGEFPKSAMAEEIAGERILLCSLDVLTVGGGRWLTINERYIWADWGNSGDGDNWGSSNVGGTISYRVPFDVELAERIRSLAEKADLDV